MEKKPLIGITMGDPAGIGAEITVKALCSPEFYQMARPLVIGDSERIRRSIGLMTETSIPETLIPDTLIPETLEVNEIADIKDARFTFGTIDVLQIKVPGVVDVDYGVVSPVAGEAAISYIFEAVKLANNGEIDAIVTSPINKEAVHLAGYTQYAGHTEILADKTNTKDFAMMLNVGDYYVIHVTTHCSLRQACDRVKRDRVKTVIRLAHDMAEMFNIPNKLVAVAGLNPHAGEAGAFGAEEIDEIIPAIEEAKAQGISVIGPVPPDSLFVRANRGEFQVMVVMYHDQGHMPVKILDFDHGVNTTLGLPIIRTSVDHGTAFDIAGKGIAGASSMIAAINMAVKLAKVKR